MEHTVKFIDTVKQCFAPGVAVKWRTHFGNEHTGRVLAVVGEGEDPMAVLSPDQIRAIRGPSSLKRLPTAVRVFVEGDGVVYAPRLGTLEIMS
jgi:hypothetical protein